METVGLVVGFAGLAGLFSTCLDLVSRFDSYKGFADEWNASVSIFDAQRLRFQIWGKTVGFQGDLADDHHENLDDPQVLSKVRGLLFSIQKWCDTLPDGSPKEIGHLIPRKEKLNWALRTKRTFLERVDSFASLVQSLHDLVPAADSPGNCTCSITKAARF